jgi:hypothetical protein
VKKAQWLSALLVVSIGSIAINANAQTKQATHKKKVHYRISERDIGECTKLIDKVAARQNKISLVPAPTKANNSKVVAHLPAPLENQLFADDHPAPLAKPVLPVQAKTLATKPTAPLAALATQPTFKPTTATLVTASPVRHVIPNPPKTKTQPIVENPFANTNKTVAPTKELHPAIEVSSAPKESDLNHLQGKSANLAEIAKSGTVDKSTSSKNKKKATTTSEKKKH